MKWLLLSHPTNDKTEAQRSFYNLVSQLSQNLASGSSDSEPLEVICSLSSESPVKPHWPSLRGENSLTGTTFPSWTWFYPSMAKRGWIHTLEVPPTYLETYSILVSSCSQELLMGRWVGGAKWMFKERWQPRVIFPHNRFQGFLPGILKFSMRIWCLWNRFLESPQFQREAVLELPSDQQRRENDGVEGRWGEGSQTSGSSPVWQAIFLPEGLGLGQSQHSPSP